MFLETAADHDATATAACAGQESMLDQLASLVAALHPEWEINRVESDDGACLLLTPTHSSKTETDFLLEMVDHRLALSVLRDDALEFLGSYGSARAVFSVCVARWTTHITRDLSPAA